MHEYSELCFTKFCINQIKFGIRETTVRLFLNFHKII